MRRPAEQVRRALIRGLNAPRRPRAARVPMVNLRPVLEGTAPDWGRNLEALFAGMQFILGEQVQAFEREFASDSGSAQAVGVGSGTAALELALRAAGIGHPRQQVITSALSSPFTALAIRNAGATPVFADVDADHLLLDPEDAADRITSRTAAILPVHLYGQICDLKRLRALARSARIALVQDACQAHGASFGGAALTRFSAAVAYSFYPTKNLGALGDGGAILTNSAALAARLRMLRDGGRRHDQISRIPAINSRLDEIQACFLRAFLPHLEEWNRRRARLAALYDEAFSRCAAVHPVRHRPDSVHHLYVIRTTRRDSLRAFLARRGIVTGIHYPIPLHLQPAFSDGALKRGALPNAEAACREILSLPLWPHLPESTLLAVAESVCSFFRR